MIGWDAGAGVGAEVGGYAEEQERANDGQADPADVVQGPLGGGHGLGVPLAVEGAELRWGTDAAPLTFPGDGSSSGGRAVRPGMLLGGEDAGGGGRPGGQRNRAANPGQAAAVVMKSAGRRG